MARSEVVLQFCAITGASEHVAEHVLEAHEWDLNSSVEFYLESGGVGHGNGSLGGLGASEATEPRPPIFSATTAPRSSPINIDDEDVVEDDVVMNEMATTLGRRYATRRHVEDIVEEVEDSSEGSGDGAMVIDGEERRRSSRRRTTSIPTTINRQVNQRTRRRRNRVDYREPSLVIDDESDGNGDGDIERNGEDVALPDDVDFEEQKMLLAALTGETYEGPLPYSTLPGPHWTQRNRVLSPGALERAELREQQDADYHESLRADQLKEEALARQRQQEELAQQEAEEAARRMQESLALKEASLPDEPSPEAEDAVQLVVRLPEGGKLKRRFRTSHQLQSVFDFVDVFAGQTVGIEPGKYNLVSQFPRRVFKSGERQSLLDANLVHKNEALFLELLS
jgi:hypothetical protein